MLKGNPINDASIKMMKPDDVVYLLIDFNLATAQAESKNKPVAVINSKKYWVFHLGIYSGDGKMVPASPWKGKVMEEKFPKQFAGYFIMTTRRK